MSHFVVGCSFSSQFVRSELNTFSFPDVTLPRTQTILPLLPHLNTYTEKKINFPAKRLNPALSICNSKWSGIYKALKMQSGGSTIWWQHPSFFIPWDGQYLPHFTYFLLNPTYGTRQNWPHFSCQIPFLLLERSWLATFNELICWYLSIRVSTLIE